ncbi:hypothetical protein TSUD_162690 [Trifolium subterraneum]|uniref:Uncharacterized protein n=1 Tax=Trifolium subterraneum TaxID=3900 RepID=A0A2Z6NRE9_TRISU|nr:hypothetical protein TSUD_162690 [Trifolium subterraneum]
MPNHFGASLHLLQKLGGLDTMNAIEEQTVVDLLKLSLISKSPLTDLILKKNQTVDNLNRRNNLEFLIGEPPSDEDSQMSVKVTGLNILKASLTSTSALQNALKKFIRTIKVEK